MSPTAPCQPSYELIVACDLNGAIGKRGAIPWQIREDLLHFKHITTNSSPGKKNAVVMGRRTWESLNGKPLKDRINIVLSRKSLMPICVTDDMVWVLSLQDASVYCDHLFNKGVLDKVFIIGGQSLYYMGIHDVRMSRVHMTLVNESFRDCDRFFPKRELYEHFEIDHIEECKNDEYSWSYMEFIRSVG
jgi:dihydrofolate reductase/thymidylate synthase